MISDQPSAARRPRHPFSEPDDDAGQRLQRLTGSVSAWGSASANLERNVCHSAVHLSARRCPLADLTVVMADSGLFAHTTLTAVQRRSATRPSCAGPTHPVQQVKKNLEETAVAAPRRGISSRGRRRSRGRKHCCCRRTTRPSWARPH